MHWRTRIPVAYVGLWYGLSVWFSLHSDHHRSAASLSNSLRCLPSVPNYCSNLTSTSVPPPPWVLVQSHSLPSTFSLPSFVLSSFAWVYVFLSCVQELLPTLSCCSVRFFVSEEVFLMIPVEKFSSTYSSSILLNHLLVVLIAKTAVSTWGFFVHILSFIDTFLLSDYIFLMDLNTHTMTSSQLSFPS